MANVYETRYSSQMLNALGAHNDISGLKYHIDDRTFPTSDQIGEISYVPGRKAYSPTVYNVATSFYTSRGASKLYADTMAAVSVDMADMVGVDIYTFLNGIEGLNKFNLPRVAVDAFNQLRSNTNQVDNLMVRKRASKFVDRLIRS